MPNIQEFYKYIQKQIATGSVRLEKDGDFGMPVLLERLKLNELELVQPAISVFWGNTFTITGLLDKNRRTYDCTIQVNISDFGNSYKCFLEARMQMETEVYMNTIYPAIPMYAAVNFCSVPFDILDKVWMRETIIRADSCEQPQDELLYLLIYYEKESFLYENYRDFLPEPKTEIWMKGSIDAPFAEDGEEKRNYILTGAFLKEIALPFYSGNKIAEKCELIVNNSAERNYSRVGVRLSYKIPELSESKIGIEIDFSAYGDVYNYFMNFENGVSFSAAGKLIATMMGEVDVPVIPTWANEGSIPLSNIVVEVQRPYEEDEEAVYNRVGLSFEMDLPSLPIPFFDKNEGGGKGELYLQWQSFASDWPLIAIIGFWGKYKEHILKINVELPDVSFQGIYERDRDEEAIANGIFPGFMDLVVDYIRLEGSLSEGYYSMDFTLVNNNLYVLPIGKCICQIDWVQGFATYSSRGIELGIGLGFMLADVGIEVEGIYEKIGGEQMLTLKGGLRDSLSVTELVGKIIGEEISSKDFDWTIDALEVAYVTCLSGDKEKFEIIDIKSNTKEVLEGLGNTRSFEFLCDMAFSWGNDNKVASVFHLTWEQDVYKFWIAATIQLLDFFTFAASCQVQIESKEMQLKNYAFDTRIRNVHVIATYDNEEDKNLVFKVENFNLGELIEGLISIIAPDHNWYLPYPFSILKQITLSNLEIKIIEKSKQIIAKYNIQFQLLFLKVESIELIYDGVNDSFEIIVNTNASLSEGIESDADSKDYILDLLHDSFPSIDNLGDRMFSLNYLGVGQHIAVDIPTVFDDKEFDELLSKLRTSIVRDNRPVLDSKNNWVAALQIKLVNAVDLSLLMCDPSFYGVKVEVGTGSKMVEQLAGLSFIIVYTKVTETIGLFYTRLQFPTAFRKIELGAIQLQLGSIALWIYTNGNFKIDMGFPQEKDFSNSFGLTYLLFTGKGGFYFGLLNGDTSKAVPKVTKGHFETVLELGIGISAGVGREIHAGPLTAGAYVLLVAIFQGVLANYVSGEQKVQTDATDVLYYKVSASVGVAASIYGKVDFAIIQVGFSVSVDFVTDLTLESYRATELSVHLALSVEAYVKILFIKIAFSFDFTWNDTFILGENGIAPWDSNVLEETSAMPAYYIEWTSQLVLTEKKEVSAEIVPFFTYDKPQIGKEASGRERVVFLAQLHGYSQQTCKCLGYQTVADTPFAILLSACLKRAVLSVKTDDSKESQSAGVVTKNLLVYLEEYLSHTNSFREGFLENSFWTFLANNIVLSYIKSENTENIEIDGIPFPLYPKMVLHWFIGPVWEQIFDLETTSSIEEDFLEIQQSYYDEMSVWSDGVEFFKLPVNEDETSKISASTFMFLQYFYMLTRIAVSLASQVLKEEQMELEQLCTLLTEPEVLRQASGMMGRFYYGGSRVYEDGEGTKSLYDFARQQLFGLKPDDFLEDAILHQMRIEYKEDLNLAKELDREPQIRLCRRDFKALQQSVQNTNVLEWSFTKKELIYPKGALLAEEELQACPFYKEQEKSEPLKNPKGIWGQPEWTLWEMQNAKRGDWQVVTDEPIVFKKGCLLSIPVKCVGEQLFEIEPLGYENIVRIISLLKSHVVEIVPYRYTNVLDSDNCGIKPLEQEVYLYRNNLCLEAEKPMLFVKERLMLSNVYENSAYSTELKAFLRLLRDASIVNAKGYYLKFKLDEKHILADTKMQLLLWVETQDYATELMLQNVVKESLPAVKTDEVTYSYAYEPGTLAFFMKQSQEENEIQNHYQMLDYQILENEFFRGSKESRPLIAQKINGQIGYQQIIPAFRFASEAGENPYESIVENSKLKLLTHRVSLLGNRDATGQVWEIPYGYTDPLIPITMYPHTKCTYEVTEQNIIVTFEYIEEQGENTYLRNSASDKNLKTAYWQLMCKDVTCSISICKESYSVDVEPLRNYLREMISGVIPQSVVYTFPFSTERELLELDIDFSINRDEKLLAEQLVGQGAAVQVLSVTSQVRPDKEKMVKSYLAQRGSDGKLFWISNERIEWSKDYELWTLPLLSNKLLDIRDILITDLKDQSQKNISFYNVDIDAWADDFLEDMEGFLAPDSIYAEQRGVCEELLKIKKSLADTIAVNVTPLLQGSEEAQDCVVEYYRNRMLQNLYTGRRIDAVLTLYCDNPLEDDNARCFSVKTNAKKLTLAPGKMKQAGILPIGLQTEDVSRQMNLDFSIETVLTDWEIPDLEMYQYLTIQKPEPVKVEAEIKGVLPYKRFPELPVLKAHNYKECKEWADNNLFFWEYHMEFSHKVAEQDSIILQFIMEDRRNRKRNNSEFLTAMAQYRYWRETFLNEAQYSKALLEICGIIAENWTHEIQTAFYEDVEVKTIEFAVSFEKNELIIQNKTLDLSNIQFAIKDSEGKYVVLQKKSENIYIIPESLPEKLEFEISLGNLDIRKENYINSMVSVIRNQGVAEQFTYRTESVSFPDGLLPILQSQSEIDMGKFEKTSFVNQISHLAESFGEVTLEFFAKTNLSKIETTPIYTTIPIVYVNLSMEERVSILQDTFDVVNRWLKENYKDSQKEVIIQVNAALYHVGEGGRMLLECENLNFYV